MALGTPTLLGQLEDGVDRSSYSITITTPTANAAVVLFAHNQVTSGTAGAVSSVSGGNLTWTLDDTQLYDGNLKRITTYVGIGASPSGTTVTVDYGSSTGGFQGSVAQVTAPDTTTPKRQSGKTTATSATSATLTLTGLLSTSYHVVGFAVDGNTRVNPESGATELSDAGHAAPSSGLAVHYRLGESAMTGDTGATSRNWGVIGVEIQEPVSVPNMAAMLQLHNSGGMVGVMYG